MWDASSVIFWHLDLVGKLLFFRKSTEVLLVFSGPPKKIQLENVPKRDPYTLLYVSINTKVMVIT